MINDLAAIVVQHYLCHHLFSWLVPPVGPAHELLSTFDFCDLFSVVMWMIRHHLRVLEDTIRVACVHATLVIAKMLNADEPEHPSGPGREQRRGHTLQEIESC